MRSSIRYSLVAVGAPALMVLTFAMLRPRLEPTAQAQTNTQVAGCDATKAPSTGPSVIDPTRSAINPCLVISKFRENGPAGSTDEFVEIFNASTVAVTVSSLSNDPNTVLNGIGVYVSAGQGPGLANQARLACQIKGSTIIPGRRWFLCAANGVPGANPATQSNALPSTAPAGAYSLANLGVNSLGTTTTNGVCTSGPGTCHSTPDATIGGPLFNGGFAPIADIPDDAGIALLDTGTDIVNQNQCSGPCGGPPGCPSGFTFASIFGSGCNVVLDKVGFNPIGPGAPASTIGSYPGNVYPSLAAQYCEGNVTPLGPPFTGPSAVSHDIGCLQPVGDVSAIPLTASQPCPASPAQLVTNPLYTTGGPGSPYDTLVTITPGSTINGVAKCYGEVGQYAFARRRSRQTFSNASGEIFKDSWNSMAGNTGLLAGPGACAQTPAPTVCGNADDFILETPVPTAPNLGTNITGINQVQGVQGVAWPHNCDTVPNGGPSATGCQTLTPAGAPPIIGNTQFTQGLFDPGNSTFERRYAQDPTIFGTANDPRGTFIVRLQYTNNWTSGSTPTGGQRWRIDDLTTNCGGPQNVSAPPGQGVATQEARNLRGPDASLGGTTPIPTCQGEGSDTGLYTAILKGVNHYGEIVADTNGTPFVVAGSVLEDIVYCGASPCGGPSVGTLGPALQPFGGGSNSTWVVNTTAVGNGVPFVAPLNMNILNGGDGVSAGTGTFAFPIAGPATPSTAVSGGGTVIGNTIFIAFKFGVVRGGHYKLLIGREVAH